MSVRRLKVLSVLAIIGFTLGVGIKRCAHKPQNVQKLSNLPKFGTMFKVDVPIYSAAIILADSKGEGFCSATVVDNHYALTAAHCLVGNNYEMDTGDIVIKNFDGHPTPIVGKAAAINITLDYALVLADFSQFNIMPADFTSLSFKSGGPWVACGFPAAAPPSVCGVVEAPRAEFFQFAAYGQLTPGMSGGPVLDVSDISRPTIIAVNTAVSGGAVILSPILGLLGAFDILPLEGVN